MIPPDSVADAILRQVVGLVKEGDHAQLHALDTFPFAIYVTDIDGFITYFNRACIDLAGRTPTVGQDRWCVTWRLYTNEGDVLPHEQCPMAVAIRTKGMVRGTTAVAERPDGNRIRFQPFPTPVVGDSGELIGAVNMLVDITDYAGLALPAAAERERLVQILGTFTIADIQNLVEEMEREQARPPLRLVN
jgi:PAS domain S-box-containing protein